MKNKILRIIGAVVIGFVILIVVLAAIGSSDSKQQSVTSPVADVIATSTPPPLSTADRRDPVTPSSVQTTTYSVQSKTSGCLANQPLPDPSCTPGAILPVTKDQVCVSGYSASVRDVPDSLKKQVFQEYGISYDQHNNYEVDHLISLELGGSNDISNLFPESYLIEYNARTKDKFENYLHKQVCNGAVTLSEAQYEISHNWIKYFDQAGLTKAPSATSATQITQPSVRPSSDNQSAGKYYTSSYATSKYYYPATCSA